MNEELKQELLAALKGLREGAPEAWQSLVSEVAAKGWAYLVLAVLAAVLGTLATRVCYTRCARLGEGDDADAVVFSGAVLIVSAALTGITLSHGIPAAFAPSVTLLESLR